MLSALDETFLHQAPVTFDQAAVSDHRFFDRMWLGAHTADHVHFFLGLAAYKNTNTFDGYCTIIKDGKQHNLRVSRPLLPDPGRMGAGPIDVSIVRPLEALRMVIAPGDGYAFTADVTFSGTVPVSLEAPHHSRVDGRITQDYSRFEQLGRLDGWIELAGERLAVDGWFAARDHSWGVRPGMGGYEPLTRVPLPGENPNDVGAGHDGFFVLALWFDTPHLAGYLMQIENGAGKILYSDGKLLKRVGAGFTEVKTRGIDHALNFVPGTRTSTGGTVSLVTMEGEKIDIEVEALIPPLCYKGTGYDGGYNDERGLGLHRGTLLEADIYDISHPEDVVLPDGRVIRPWHREAGAKVRIGDTEGMAHFPCISSGRIVKYGLDAPATNRNA